jgi:hypothetical protein
MKFFFFILFHITFCQTCHSFFKIEKDPNLDSIIEQVRNKYLATRPNPFKRLDVTLLIPKSDGSWSEGSFNPNEVAYPASCVKLAYLVSAMKWCNDQGLPPTCIDEHTHLMIMNSDNLQTGIVVDLITGAPNIRNLTDSNSFEFKNWLAKRKYASNYLDELGLLGNQTILSKTYPTNSGQTPNGAEYLAREIYGSNMMNPVCSAYLMLGIIKGAIQPQAKQYMKEVLFHRRWDTYSSFGFGLPPGTIMYTKLGSAYNDLQEISYSILPNGKEFILSVFSDGYESDQPFPYDVSNLGVFAEMIIEKSGLSKGNPTSLVFDCNSPGFYTSGQWQVQNNASDQYGKCFYLSKDPQGIASWDVELSEGGLYELTVWFPQNNLYSSSTTFSVKNLDGIDHQNLNQNFFGGRWIYLGDYDFVKGLNEKIVTVSNVQIENIFVANAVKLTRWPYCRGVPGLSC